MQQLSVWAERREGFVRVGELSFDLEEGEWFEYDRSYLSRSDATPIYPILPLDAGRFDPSRTRAAFASLGPEGPVGRDIRTALRAGRDAVTPVLARLGNETVGALTFTQPEEKPNAAAMGLLAIDEAYLERFAAKPEARAFDALMASRLSLNGAVSKIGLARQGGQWFLPQGLEPSTHIVKAGSPSYPNQMLNEALCMRCAELCGFDDAPKTELALFGELDPLLISKRFDRAEVGDRPQGLPHVMRLHQADFCQLLGMAVDSLKYTPSDDLVEGYTNSIAQAIVQESDQRYGDRVYVFSMLAFDYLVGNCDNHLKNLSMTWRPDWSGKTVSPIYDLTCTTIYTDLSREMGLGIGQHRAIDQVVPEDFLLMAQQLGVGEEQAKHELASLADTFAAALMDAAHGLELEYGVAAVALAEQMMAEGAERREVVSRAAGA